MNFFELKNKKMNFFIRRKEYQQYFQKWKEILLQEKTI